MIDRDADVQQSKTCTCSAGTTLIFACSGASDVGEITDRAARTLTREGAGRMYCLAGIGGQVNDIMLNTRAADKILAINGCDKDCARNTLTHAGFDGFHHIRLSDEGMQKGAFPANEENIAAVVRKGGDLLRK